VGRHLVKRAAVAVNLPAASQASQARRAGSRVNRDKQGKRERPPPAVKTAVRRRRQDRLRAVPARRALRAERMAARVGRATPEHARQAFRRHRIPPRARAPRAETRALRQTPRRPPAKALEINPHRLKTVFLRDLPAEGVHRGLLPRQVRQGEAVWPEPLTLQVPRAAVRRGPLVPRARQAAGRLAHPAARVRRAEVRRPAGPGPRAVRSAKRRMQEIVAEVPEPLPAARQGQAPAARVPVEVPGVSKEGRLGRPARPGEEKAPVERRRRVRPAAAAARAAAP